MIVISVLVKLLCHRPFGLFAYSMALLGAFSRLQTMAPSSGGLAEIPCSRGGKPITRFLVKFRLTGYGHEFTHKNFQFRAGQSNRTSGHGIAGCIT